MTFLDCISSIAPAGHCQSNRKNWWSFLSVDHGNGYGSLNLYRMNLYMDNIVKNNMEIIYLSQNKWDVMTQNIYIYHKTCEIDILSPNYKFESKVQIIRYQILRTLSSQATPTGRSRWFMPKIPLPSTRSFNFISEFPQRQTSTVDQWVKPSRQATACEPYTVCILKSSR